MRPNDPCPCGRRVGVARQTPAAWGECCGRWIEQGAYAPDAESLMRSRYAAFVTGNTDYLLATWHPRTRPEDLALEPDVKWLGLEVRQHHVTGPETAEVEFVARSRHAGRGHRLHERSRFVQENGRWLYVDGDML